MSKPSSKNNNNHNQKKNGDVGVTKESYRSGSSNNNGNKNQSNPVNSETTTTSSNTSSQSPSAKESPASSSAAKLGIVGLGKMGGNLSLQAVEKGIQVIGKALREKPELEKQGVKVTDNYRVFVNFLTRPRVVYLSLPAGPTVDAVLDELVPYLDKGDVVMDGGNSFYLDSIDREEKLKKKGIYFIDCGTSGGLEGARHGACFMVGGDPHAVKIAEPILKALAINENGFLYTGKPGSGHFVKLVHNGIEFGMLQAIGEGVVLLRKNDFGLNLLDIFRNWSNGSVIRGWLVELMEEGLHHKDLGHIESYVEDTGEVNWLVHYALNKEIPIPVISQSIMELFKSRLLEGDDAYKSIALMRHGFGGHPFGSDEKIAKERRTSRIKKV